MISTGLRSVATLATIARDLLVWLLPGRLPEAWRRRLYGPMPDFIFITHARGPEDIWAMAPGLKRALRFLPERLILPLLRRCPAFAVCDMAWPERKLRGRIVSPACLMEDFFGRRARTACQVRGLLDFIRKTTAGPVHAVLSGWWPAATDKGRMFQEQLAPDDRITITTGHTATLLSLCATVGRVLEMAHIAPATAAVAVLGVGNMGETVARALNGTVQRIGLLDRNITKARRVAARLRAAADASEITVCELDAARHFDAQAADFLARHTVTVCTTMNATRIFTDESCLHDCLIIDDARPEAFSRIDDPSRRVLVLEGGLIRIPGFVLPHDFGFGVTDSVFGCLAEAVLLCCDPARRLRPVIGDVDFANYREMLAVARENAICEGALRCGRRLISAADIARIIHRPAMTAPRRPELAVA